MAEKLALLLLAVAFFFSSSWHVYAVPAPILDPPPPEKPGSNYMPILLAIFIATGIALIMWREWRMIRKGRGNIGKQAHGE